MLLKVKKLDPEAKIPVFANHNDAGMDIFALEDTILPPGEVVKVRSGVAMEIPDGCVGLCWDKSSIAINNSVKVLGGVIDAGYRGEILIGMINLGKSVYTFQKGHKVVNFIIQKIEHPEVTEVETLEESSRGTGGFGSTGK